MWLRSILATFSNGKGFVFTQQWPFLWKSWRASSTWLSSKTQIVSLYISKTSLFCYFARYSILYIYWLGQNSGCQIRQPKYCLPSLIRILAKRMLTKNPVDTFYFLSWNNYKPILYTSMSTINEWSLTPPKMT